MHLKLRKIDCWIKRIESGLSYISYLMIAGMFALVIVSVTQRFFGYSPIRSAIPLVEYFILYVPLLMAPRLVRNKGHVYVELGMELVQNRLARLILEKIIYVLAAIISLAIVYGASRLFYNAWIFGYIDIRSIDIPEWYGYLPFIIGFGFSAYEFLRYLFTQDSYYRADGNREFI